MQNLEQLMEVFKPTTNILNKDSRFFELDDSEGWSDGYIADLTPTNVELMKATAITRKAEMTSQKPKIKQLINTTNEHEVEKVEFDLKSKTAILENSKLKANVNPKFIGYFVKAYDKLGSITLRLTSDKTPINVYLSNRGSKDELIGLIMPVRPQK